MVRARSGVSWVVSGVLLLGWAAGVLLAPGAALAEGVRLVRVTPTGDDVPPPAQVVFTFDRDMVPVGRMSRRADEVPIRIEPALDCQWLWLDTTSLACQLGEAGRARLATRYRITLDGSLRALDGSKLGKSASSSFLTQRPVVRSTWNSGWLGPGTPVFTMFLDPDTDPASAAQHVYVSIGGSRRVAVRVEPRLRERRGGGEDDSEGDGEPSAEPDAGEAIPGMFEVTPVEALPEGEPGLLMVEPGLRSRQGPERGVEKRTLVEFATFPRPEFLGVRCSDNSSQPVFWSATASSGEPPLAGRPLCNPKSSAALVFSAPVLATELAAHLRAEPDFAGGRTDYDPWAPVPKWSRLSSGRRSEQTYDVPLPSPLRAAQTYRLQAGAGTIRDEFGRPLDAAIDIELVTGHRPPEAVLMHRVSVLESGIQSQIPIVVTNKQSLTVGGTRIDARGSQPFTRTVSLPQVEDVAFAFPVPLREELQGRSGAFVAGVTTSPLPLGWRDDRQAFFSQITPFAVHAKLGHHDSLVWVTDMATGRAVRGAAVEILASPLDPIPAAPDVLSTATTDGSGLAVLSGTRSWPANLAEGYYSDWGRPRPMVRVRKGDDQALLPAIGELRVWAQGSGGQYIYTDPQPEHGHIRAWGTTAQGIYRPGDTVQYVFWMRDQDGRRFVPAPKGTYTLEVVDPAGQIAHRRADIELGAFGEVSGELAVPKTAVTGSYEFRVTPSFDPRIWIPLQVLISDFTPAPFKVTTELEGERFAPGDAVRVATQAALHSGGSYGSAQTRVLAQLVPGPIQPAAPRAQGFVFGGSARAEAEMVHRSDAALDERGELATAFELPESAILYGSLRVESAVRDDRGKSIAASASARYVGRDRYLGLRREGWLLEAGDEAVVEALVIDAAGELRGDTEVAIAIEYREVVASRVKGAGNAYLTKFEERWVEVASCRGTPAQEPYACRFEPARPGSYRMRGSIADTQGRRHETELRAWATGDGDVLWPIEEGHRLEITPEQTEYKVGQTARFLVQSPFENAQALITTERLGAISSEVRRFTKPTEIVEIEIEPDHVPGFYLSVVVSSPRVAPPPADGELDLGKPAFRMGYVAVPVRDPVKEIQVEAKVARDTYKPRERVSVEIRARTRQGDAPPMQAVVAVVDEAVLDLLRGGAERYDPYRGFYQLEPLDVQNYDLLMALVGQVRFEKKGDNAGGDGGLTPELRSLFKFVSYWNPALALDADARASVDFEVPDNLTGWRVLVLAVTAEDRFGLGQTRFSVNRPTELRSALPSQVLEGDQFQARFTVMNRTPEPRRLEVVVEASGDAEARPPLEVEVDAPPYVRVPVQLAVRATRPGQIALKVRAGDASDADALALALPVGRRMAPITAATHVTSDQPELSVPFAIPREIREDTGELRVVASPSALGGLDGAFRYMRDYPYECWEQRLSKGVMAAHYLALRAYLPEALEWPDADAAVKTMLSQAADFQAPSGGMTYYRPLDGYVSPYLSAYTALAFRWLAERGYAIPTAVESRLQSYLEHMLRDEVFPSYYVEGMAASVRAVALAALARGGRLEPAEVQRFAPHVPRMTLFGLAHYADAAVRVQRPELARTAVDRILAHADQGGGKLRFVEAIDTVYGRMHHTPERSTCAILSTFAALEPGALGVPEGWPSRVVRFLTQARQRSDRFENTQENVFCLNALAEYAARFEQETPDMQLTTRTAQGELGSSHFSSVRDAPVTHARSLRPGDAGRTDNVVIQKTGPGRYYAAVQLQYALLALPTEPRNAGIEVVREYSVARDGGWAVIQPPYALRRGELVRVELFLTVPAARNFVVLSDPVPGGLEAVDRNLATSSEVDVAAGDFERSGGSYWYRYNDWRDEATTRWQFYHQETRADAVRFYSEYLPPGRYTLSYTAQAIAEGEFSILPVHAEEMYDPEVAGDGVPAALRVDPE